MTRIEPICGDCKQRKNREDFYVDRKLKNGLHTYCKDCCKKRASGRYQTNPKKYNDTQRDWVKNNREKARLHKIKSVYGLTKEQYDSIPKVCQICFSEENLQIDHCHQSGRVRGMLCMKCNRGIGLLKDNPALLDRAAQYLWGYPSFLNFPRKKKA